MASISSITTITGSAGTALSARAEKEIGQVKKLGSNLTKAKNALTDAIARGADSGVIESMKINLEEASNMFKAQLSVSDVINRLINQIIERIAQIGR